MCTPSAMISTLKSKMPPPRMAFLATVAVFASLVILALLPMLLRQTTARANPSPSVPVVLTPLTMEDKSPAKPEDAPPELEIVEVPKITIPEPEPLPPIRIETPSTQNVAAKTVQVPPSAQGDASVHSGTFNTSQPIRYNMDEVDRKPRGTKTAKPDYPFRARRMSIEGYVTVRFLVDRNGETRELTILEAKPEGVFEPEVLKALPKWRFEPAQKDGRAVETWVKTTIEFKLT